MQNFRGKQGAWIMVCENGEYSDINGLARSHWKESLRDKKTYVNKSFKKLGQPVRFQVCWSYINWKIFSKPY